MGRMRILIADDEPIIRMGLKSMLSEAGHEVIAAQDGREALTLARQHRPDLAILDIKMPFTDGLQAAQTLARKQPLPILILTAFSEQDLIAQAADLPIHGYLIKPVQLEALEAAMAVAVKRFEDAQTLQLRADELEESLAARKLIERAKGRLMAAGMSEAAAFRHLQQRARMNGKAMRAVAEAILREQRRQ